MKTLLSVDFDIIMGPSIQIYNSLVPQGRWEDLMNIPQLALSHADYEVYQNLTENLINIIKKMENKENVFFVYNHEQLVDCIPHDEEYDVINVDHHHDLGYVPKEEINARPELKEECTCANWAWWMYNHGMLGRYSWIKNNSSQLPSPDCEIVHSTVDWREVSSLENYVGTPDYVVLVLSPPWVPPYLAPLYNMWLKVFEEVTGYKYSIIEPPRRQEPERPYGEGGYHPPV